MQLSCNFFRRFARKQHSVRCCFGTEYIVRIKNGDITWQKLQKHSAFVSNRKTERWNLELVKDDIYAWTLNYDEFLGYMAGVPPRL